MNIHQKGILPTVTVDELAVMTAKGFGEVHLNLKEGFASVKEEFSNVRKEMKDEFTNVRREMKEEFTNVRSEMNVEFTNVRTEMKEGFSGVRQSLALILENMATKSDIALVTARTSDIERTVYKDHNPRLRRVEHELHIV
jgi:hypothetical protein